MRALELKVTADDIDVLFAQLPVLGANIDDASRAAMKADLPTYLALASGLQSPSDTPAYTKFVLDFWRANKKKLHPAWALAARIAFAITPNSASSERVFSVMKRLFGKTTLRDSVYADMMTLSMKLAFNGE